MLVAVSVENFRSFRDTATLSLEPSSDKRLPERILRASSERPLPLLRSAALYGANASGKSNLLRALLFAKFAVLRSAKEPGIIGGGDDHSFRLDAEHRGQPASVCVDFIVEGVRYSYGFSACPDRVAHEWLESFPHRRRRLLFERKAKGDQVEVSFGDSWRGEGQRLVAMVRPDALFLSVAAQFNHPRAKLVADWFANQLLDVMPWPRPHAEQAFTLQRARESPEHHAQILKLLAGADLQVRDFEVHERPLEAARQARGIPAEVIKDLGQKKGAPLPVLEATLIHDGKDAAGRKMRVALELDEESHGTQKLFCLAGPLSLVLSRPAVLVADELDMRLHPLLSQEIVRLFHDPETNPHGSQLIFASHDVELLNNDIFRRDQVWITERDSEGASTLHSLWDIRSRKGENLRKGYLAGRYGGIPVLDGLLQSEGA
jgi:hypothetical protein